jgi:hypothetical protein
MALASNIHRQTQDDASVLGFAVPDVWNWKSDSDDPDLRDVIVLTDQTVFITRDMSSDAARKMVMAAAENDLAVTARAAASRRRQAIPLKEIVEVTWTSCKSGALLHTTSGRAASLDLPNERLTEEVCEAIATKAGYGKRTETDLGRPADDRPFAPAAATALICAGIGTVYAFDPDFTSAVPTPALVGSCGILVIMSVVYAYKRLRTTQVRTAISVDRRRPVLAT